LAKAEVGPFGVVFIQQVVMRRLARQRGPPCPTAAGSAASGRCTVLVLGIEVVRIQVDPLEFQGAVAGLQRGKFQPTRALPNVSGRLDGIAVEIAGTASRLISLS